MCMLQGLTGFGPNINIARDPRFGRISELPGEDPYLSGTYAANMVQGVLAQLIVYSIQAIHVGC